MENSFVSLLSTGLDSPIATYLMMKKGMNCISLSFLNGSSNREINKKKIIATGNLLVKLTNQQIKMYFLDYDAIVEKILDSITAKYTCLICKRTMLQVASTLAQQFGAKFIVNGDILGEQASQTLDNLSVVHQIQNRIPVIRPLIGFNKLDIIKLNQNLGFYEISLMEGISCEFNPKYPETRAKLQIILEEEEKINRKDILDKILDTLEYIEIFPESKN